MSSAHTDITAHLHGVPRTLDLVSDALAESTDNYLQPTPGEMYAENTTRSPPPATNQIHVSQQDIHEIHLPTDKTRINLLRSENRALMRRIKQMKKERKGGLLLSRAQIDTYFKCDICWSTFSHPVMLPACGHVFCQTCIYLWFITITSGYAASHPRFSPTVQLPDPIQVLMAVQNRWIEDQESLLFVDRLLSQYRQPQPRYTCPTCREQARSKPVPVTALRDITYLLQPTQEVTDNINTRWDQFFAGRLDIR